MRFVENINNQTKRSRSFIKSDSLFEAARGDDPGCAVIPPLPLPAGGEALAPPAIARAVVEELSLLLPPSTLEEAPSLAEGCTPPLALLSPTDALCWDVVGER